MAVAREEAAQLVEDLRLVIHDKDLHGPWV
jgi:hypothetical protein